MSKTLIAVAAAASMLASGTAAPAMAAEPMFQTVAYHGHGRGHDRHWDRGRGYRGDYHRRYYDNRRYYRKRDNHGDAVAAGVLGFALGAAIVGASRSPNYGMSSHQQYCASKYRSYDPRSDTYMGYDGYRHYCQ